MMKRLIFCFLFLCLLSSYSFCADLGSVGFQEEWFISEVDFNQFQELYVRTIDLRGLLIELGSDDEDGAGQTYAEGLDEVKIEEVAYALYQAFSEKLISVIPVVDYESEPVAASDKKALAVDLELSGTFKAGEKGLLLRATSRVRNSSTPVLLSFKCTLSDSQEDKKILSLTDVQKFVTPYTERPLVTKKETEELSDLFDIWSYRLANFLSYRRDSSQ